MPAAWCPKCQAIQIVDSKEEKISKSEVELVMACQTCHTEVYRNRIIRGVWLDEQE